jgi:hypothetical protein
VPVIGPAIDIIIALILVGLLVARSALGPGWWQRRGGRSGGGSAGAGPRTGPRDW